ncbi:MAG: hypothetical protein K0B00_07005 [Rhodobacteraceae bacterium]|nr:hypothetical protein [Paracoccaceae bacterium]
MTRHIADHERKGEDADRLRAFVEIERSEKPSPATTKAQRQSGRGADAGRRMEEFVRIEKGREA